VPTDQFVVIDPPLAVVCVVEVPYPKGSDIEPNSIADMRSSLKAVHSVMCFHPKRSGNVLFHNSCSKTETTRTTPTIRGMKNSSGVINEIYLFPNVRGEVSLLAFGTKACPAGDVPKVPKGQGLTPPPR